jgi:hypothetical protein
MWILYYPHDLQSKHLSDLYILSLYLQTHNPFSVVLITLYGSIHGSIPDFCFAKILVNTTIKDSRVIVLSWCKCDRVVIS